MGGSAAGRCSNLFFVQKERMPHEGLCPLRRGREFLSEKRGLARLGQSDIGFGLRYQVDLFSDLFDESADHGRELHGVRARKRLSP
ncbi:hypothetical protein CHELA1G2_14582 [Hyphomicrobiales bacterium]|nr:hypothetical protein CHELA1G2_14582 [Hyphomicrobiales bacterium]